MKFFTAISLVYFVETLWAATLNVGSGQTYSTVYILSQILAWLQILTILQIAVAYSAASAGDTIYIYPGTYKEKLTISKDSITLKGSAYPSTSPSSNLAVITYSTYASAAGTDDASGISSPFPFRTETHTNNKKATLLVSGNNFKMYNLNITNTAGTAGQAVALSMRGLYGGVYACGLVSYQDTLYSHVGSQFFGRCYIEGAVDFIFGITGNSWYQGCTLGVLKSGGTITAQGRTSSSTDGFFVFDKA